jgi:hypothetical protein
VSGAAIETPEKAPTEAVYDAESEAIMLERLRALGYVE